MGWFRKTAKATDSADARTPDPGAEGRRAPRFQTAVVSCMLGEVADLSSCGMCVVCGKAPPLGHGDLVRLELHSPTDELLVVGRVTRIQKRRPMGFEVGIEFQQFTPELRAALDSLARHGCIKGAGRRAAAREQAESSQRSVAASVSVQLPDLYALLGVSPGATGDDIHRAFRELARRLHPDLNPSPEAQAKFIDLHKAYDVLKCPEKRGSYDAARQAGASGAGAKAAA